MYLIHKIASTISTIFAMIIKVLMTTLYEINMYTRLRFHGQKLVTETSFTVESQK